MRFKLFFINIILHKKLFFNPLRGLMHFFIFYGFLVYSVSTVNQFIEAYLDGFHFPIFLDPNHLPSAAIYAFTLDLFSLLVLAALLFFGFRRWVFKAQNLDRPSIPSAVVILMIAVLMLSSLWMESASFALMEKAPLYKVAYSPIREFGALMFKSFSPSELALNQKIGWWLHIISVLSFAVYVPNSKHAHLIFAPFNHYFANLNPKGQMSFINLEAEDATWGVANIQDFKWTSLLDGFSCIECGRCTDACPAFATGKPLDPKKVIVEIKHGVLEKLPKLRQAKKEKKESLPQAAIFPDYIKLDAVWSCTTCGACVEVCPVGNNPMEKLTDIRRYKVLADAEFSTDLQNAFTNMEKQSNPWGIGAEKRLEWAEGLNVKTLAENKDVEFLFWVGCAGSFDERAKKVSRALVKIFQKANLSFGILGKEEKCTGDSARRGGNEYLFQLMAEENINILNSYSVKKIITMCPHCYNTLKNEYPQLNGNFEVYHHSEFLKTLFQSGKLSLHNSAKQKIAFHDSCYLGRYNGLYQEPRDVLGFAKMEVVAPKRSGRDGFCCGAGGAQMWVEEKEPRVNDNRTTELLSLDCKTIGVNCPFCLTMLEDGVKNKGKEEQIKVKDIAEIVAEALGI